MIECESCEHFMKGPNGEIGFKCNPFGTIKEPECLAKWQLVRMAEMSRKLDRLVAAHEATVQIYKRLQPMQEKMFKFMEREIEDQEEGDSWKQDSDDDEVDGVDGDDDAPGYGFTGG